MTVASVVIVGAGAAGTAAATQLRTLGFDGDLTLVHGEGPVPYNRTAVNKTLLQPDARLESVRTVLPDDAPTVLLTGRAQGLDIPRRAVVLQDGSRLSYDAAIIATGARPRLLPARVGGLDGPALSGLVTPLRTSDDADHIRRLLADVGRRHERPARVGIVGASLLGSETADVLTTLGHEVFLIGAAADPMARRLGTTIARWVRKRHEEHLAGLIEARVDSLEVAGDGLRLALSNGTGLTVDLVIEALGVDPDVDWLRDSPLALDDGVLVDDRLRAVNVEGVYAAGDLARVEGSTRIEHWGHALAQGAHVARTVSHDLRRTEDPGPFGPSGSYSTWLYGKAINVLGSPCPRRDREVVLAPPGHETHVTVFTSAEHRVSAAVTLGSAKLANRLRPLVVARAAVEEVADVVTATLSPTSGV
ncbi:NAD(P)/FAD-dependent oxidoreductase [Nocardioides pelophilus]|uniref:NAD(P)/FAD-dependent oxidoreductase n=1 Tax=Nocardioides pelophilus TaxID=2172019 RepID=UPI00160441FA|nr:NAD(P)/FAD-dependent oxidoreductase [Nocardioides pelophilus]